MQDGITRVRADVRYGSEANLGGKVRVVRLVPTADIAPKFIPSLPELTIGSGVALKGKIGSPMSQRAEHYRGYNIDGNTLGRGWSVEVHPNTPDLPILRRAVFRVMHPAWTEALVEARARIDAILR